MFVLMPLFLVIGQEAKVEIELETEHILFGQTTYARYTIFNISESPIYIGGYQHKSGNFQLTGYEAKAIYPDGKEVPQHKDAEMIIGKKATPKKVLKRGECLTFSQPVPITDVTIEELPFGQYKLIFILRYSLKEEEGLFEKEVQASKNFYIEKPEGEDAGWLQYVGEVKKKLFQEHPERVALKRPLGWGDVLACGFCSNEDKDIRVDLLQKYPTSTYAGYVLVKHGPSGSLKDASKITPEKFDERFYIVGSDEEKEKKRKEAKQKYEDFILQARKYLALHPEFPMASLLKKEIVNALFYTDRKDEAWIEMEALSKMEGEWAEEAKAVLAKKNEKSNKPEEKGGQREKRE